ARLTSRHDSRTVRAGALQLGLGLARHAQLDLGLLAEIGRIDERRVEVHVHDADIARHGAKLIVSQVARRRIQRTRTRVRRDHRRRARRYGVVERCVGYVLYVDEHAEPVHLAHDLLAVVGEAAGARAVHADRRTGPIVPVVPGEGHVASTASIEIAEVVERILDRVAALDAD